MQLKLCYLLLFEVYFIQDCSYLRLIDHFSFILECKVPYAIIFGGTDLNEHHKDKEKLFFMSKAVLKARLVKLANFEKSSLCHSNS